MARAVAPQRRRAAACTAAVATLVAVMAVACFSMLPRAAEATDTAATGVDHFAQLQRNSLMLYYPFEAQARDDAPKDGVGAGFGLNGVVVGAVVALQGNDGKGMLFDGASDRIETALDVNPEVQPQLTFGAWVKPITAHQVPMPPGDTALAGCRSGTMAEQTVSPTQC